MRRRIPPVRQSISIHALREESDAFAVIFALSESISIHALREESDRRAVELGLYLRISIHALREESDAGGHASGHHSDYFNPRSP